MEFDFAQRLDLGLGNPNRTGAWICLAMLTAWLPAFLYKKGFGLSMVLVFLSALLLLWTASRGALVAAAIGHLILLAWSWRHWDRKHWIVLASTLLMLFCFSTQLKIADRVNAMPEDRSVLNRLVLWEKSLRMIHDAPAGWGIGNAAPAYHQWYQEPGSDLLYKNLVNTHLTWLVEVGWVARVAYLMGWTLCLLCCFPPAGNSWMAVPLAVWTALGVTAFFSSVADNAAIWFLPVILLISVLIWRVKHRLWPRSSSFLGAAATSLAISLGLFFSGLAVSQQPSVSRQGEAIRLGQGENSIIVAAPVRSIQGEKYGHSLRRFLSHSSSNPLAVWIVEEQDLKTVFSQELSGIPLILAGEQAGSSQWQSLLADPAARLVFLNPVLRESDVQTLAAARARIWVIRGALRPRPDLGQWEKLAARNPNVTLHLVPGAAEYLGSWPELAFELLQAR